VGYVRSLFPPLPRQIWLLQTTGLAVFGTGVAIPFLVIYGSLVLGRRLPPAVVRTPC